MTRPAPVLAAERNLQIMPAGGWAMAAGAAALVYLDLAIGGLRAAEFSVGAVVALLTILAFTRWPGLAMGSILAWVPLQPPVLAYLYQHGLPGVVARDLGYVKDAATIGLCLAVLMPRRGAKRLFRMHVDWVDRFALGYVGIATAYLLLPVAFPGSLGGQAFGVRLNAWRLDCLFVVLMFAARRVSVSAQTLRRLRMTVFLVSAVVIGIGVWEWVDSTAYNNFFVHTIGLPAYQANVLNTPAPYGLSYVVQNPDAGGIRIGSLFVDPLVLGFYMVLPLAYGIERLPDSMRRVLPILGVAGGAVMIVLTVTRSAILSGGVVVLLSVWLAVRRRAPGRLRLVVLIIGALILIAPFAAESSARVRFESLFSTTQSVDNQGHITASTNGLNDVIDHPTGFGLGANPATGVRNHTTNATNTENSYLGVGTELGDAAMFCFIGLYLALLVELRRRSHEPGEAAKLAGASWLAGCGLLVGGLFLPIWPDFPVALTYWGLAGFATMKPAIDAEPYDALESPDQADLLTKISR